MAEDPQAYPAAPSKGGGANMPMPEDEQQVASSTTEEQEPVNSETATPQEAIEGEAQDEQEVPFHEHPRWKERDQEWQEKLEVERAKAEEATRLAHLALERQPQQAPPPQEDPWKGLVDHPDPATAQWYQQQKAITERTAERIAETKLSSVMQAVDAGRQELAAMKIAEFRKENPDIKPGSQEEQQVIQGLNQGYNLEDSRKLALFNKIQQENQELKTRKNAVPRKAAAANVEASSGIPESSGLPAKQGDWRDRAAEVIDKGGSMRDVANSLFGKSKR